MNWRAITLLLLATNFIYWAMNTWVINPSRDIVDHQVDASVPILNLVEATQATSNLSNAGSNTSLVNSEEAVPSSQSMDASKSLESAESISQTARSVCHRIGYFINQAESNKAKRWLEKEGYKVESVSDLRNVFTGYWIYLPSYPNGPAAAQVVTALKEKNIQDLFVVGTDQDKHAISLGLFRQRTGAEQRLKQIQTLGFPAKLRNREAEQEVYWLQLDVAQGLLPPIGQIPVMEGQVRRLERKSCGQADG